MGRVCLRYTAEPERDRWVKGDRYLRPLLRRALRGRRRPGGLDKVFLNLCLGLDRLGVEYVVNLPFDRLRPDDCLGVLGRGRACLEGYDRPNPIVAGIGLMTHPSEWPTLCEEYPVVRYLQHSAWANEIYVPYFGSRCAVWPVGIDTEAWRPDPSAAKTIDFLVYDKIHWDRERMVPALLEPIRDFLRERALSYGEVRYGAYRPDEYRTLLRQCRAMIFLCEHESQGIAYQEALSSGVPILAWDQGRFLDPNRVAWGQPEIPATSVPYWDERCGVKFLGADDFPAKLGEFLDGLRAGRFAPRDYILEHLTLEQCARAYLALLDETTP